MNPEFVNHAPSHLNAARKEILEAIDLADEPSETTDQLKDIEEQLAKIEDHFGGIVYE